MTFIERLTEYNRFTLIEGLMLCLIGYFYGLSVTLTGDIQIVSFVAMMGCIILFYQLYMNKSKVRQ